MRAGPVLGYCPRCGRDAGTEFCNHCSKETGMAKKRARKAAGLGGLLKNWNVLNARLLSLPEEDVARLLEMEKEGQDRLTFKLRLHQRLGRMRRERERQELAR